ncbi:glycosyltransferase [Altericroceibacterium spongiae]|uniref:Glycosyltransferase n=1 Tax=Altericroceibacterium spongiae TaxID=2320269 RepID=A0A420EM70_9SPHN|nr:glycosyltransferase [Altericroceibacterium spongiae]RKF21817.1 glycosyltransferase [Altericroceibacterium spongiae]
MRILYVINSLDGGGGALPLVDILQSFRDAGHEAIVVSLMERDGRARPAVERAGFETIVIGGTTRRFLSTGLRLDRIVRNRQPDVILTSLSHATLTGQIVGRLRGVPVVSWQHNAWLKPANEKWLRRLSGLSCHWITDSETVADFARKRLRLSEDRITIWPMFVADGALPSSYPGQHGPVLRLGSLGRLHRNKGYDGLIRAMARLAELSPELAARLSVHVAGEGPELDALENLAGELGVTNLIFEGFVDRPLEFLAALDGYVQPSHHEGLCIAAHQAMAAGLPIIASPVGEMARSIEISGCGTLIPYGDEQGWAQALAAWLSDPKEGRRKGKMGRDWVLHHYSREKFLLRGQALFVNAGLNRLS